MNDKKLNKELIKLLKRGDMKAFDAIYHQYCSKLYNFVLRYLKQKEDAEGIVQEVFIKIWEKRENIDLYSSFDSFLFTIAYNSTISLLRKRMTEIKSREFLKSKQSINNAVSVIDELQYKDLKHKVDNILNTLTPRQKEIYKLSREEGLSHKEISEKLQISENTVKNHLVAVLKVFKENLYNNMVIGTLFFDLFIF